MQAWAIGYCGAHVRVVGLEGALEVRIVHQVSLNQKRLWGMILSYENHALVEGSAPVHSRPLVVMYEEDVESGAKRNVTGVLGSIQVFQPDRHEQQRSRGLAQVSPSKRRPSRMLAKEVPAHEAHGKTQPFRLVLTHDFAASLTYAGGDEERQGGRRQRATCGRRHEQVRARPFSADSGKRRDRGGVRCTRDRSPRPEHGMNGRVSRSAAKRTPRTGAGLRYG